jgi:hypothetical protein
MKKVKSFDAFVNESSAETNNGLITKEIEITFDIEWNESIGKVKDKFTLAMSPDSTGVFGIGKDIEKFSGLKPQEAKEYKETPDDAYIYGLCNIMNGGEDIYFWTNGNRLKGAGKQNGMWPAIIEQISHEAGVHLTRKILTRAIAKNKGIDLSNDDWVKNNYGSGEYMWPGMGDNEDKKNPIILIDEEAFATAAGLICQQVTPHFIEMATAYFPELATQNVK